MKLCQETVREPFLTASSVSTRTPLNMLVVTEPSIPLHFYPVLANFSKGTVKNQKPKQSSLISSLPKSLQDIQYKKYPAEGTG